VNPAGIVLIVAGLFIVFQLLRGKLLDRIGITV
jgi:hypothetical protein